MILSDDTRVKQTDEGVVVEPKFVGLLRSQGYQIEDIDVKVIASDSRDVAHMVYQIDTYAFPKDSLMLDVANPEHQVRTHACTCEDFVYNHTPKLSDPAVTPDDVGTCKHIEKAYKSVRAANDDNQETLF